MQNFHLGIQTVIDRVHEAIDASKDIRLGIGKLLEIESSLAGDYVYLIGQAALAQESLNRSYWHRKVSQSREQIKARNAGAKSVSDAEKESLLKIHEEIDQENRAVGAYEYLNATCKGIDRVLTSLTHRIKNLENELARSNKGHRAY